MATPPHVGVVVPTRNRLQRTKRFVEWFLRQTYQGFTLYMVDSNSTDGTLDWLRSSAGRKLVLIEAGDDEFWTGATNLGVERALRDGCDYVLTINDDSIPSGNLLETLLRHARQGEYGILGSRINFLDDPSRVWSVGAYNRWGTHHIFQLHDHAVDEDTVMQKYAGRTIVPAEGLCGNGVLIRKSVFESIGRHDEVHCPHYHADSEFVMRARAARVKVGVCLDAILYNDTSAYPRAETPAAPRSRWSGIIDSIPVVEWIAWLSRVHAELFFNPRSEARLATVFHIVMRYAPRGRKWRTLHQYYLNALRLFVFPVVRAKLGRWYAWAFQR